MSYKKGKDLKQQGDCLVYCYTRKFQITGHNHLVNIKPSEFEKW